MSNSDVVLHFFKGGDRDVAFAAIKSSLRFAPFSCLVGAFLGFVALAASVER